MNELALTNMPAIAEKAPAFAPRQQQHREQRAEARQAALERDAQRYRKLRNASMDERNRLEHYAGPELDKMLDALPAVRAA